MQTQPIVVEISKDADIDAAATEIGHAIASAVKQGYQAAKEAAEVKEAATEGEDHSREAETTQSDDEPGFDSPADNLDCEALEKVCQTDEFRRFYDDVYRKLCELKDIIEANREKYNCSIVAGLVYIKGRKNHKRATLVCGRNDSIRNSIFGIANNNDLAKMMLHAGVSRF